MNDRAVAVLLLLLACACGGGGGSRPDPPAPPQVRTDLLLGYYFSRADTANETKDHANLFWSTYSEDEEVQALGLKRARANGQRAVVMLPPWLPAEEALLYLERLKARGAMWPGIAALYFYDEPDVNGKTEAEVLAASAALRLAASKFPELAGVKLAVIYGCGTNSRPGIASFDWIGCDQYELGCAVLTNGVDRLAAALRPDQRLMLIPGGADPWRQDPACFVAYAHANPQVVAIVGFLWNTVGSMIGIRDNGMNETYSAAGRKLKGATP